MVNHTRRYQRNLVITLLDLKKAFDELDHNLITSVLHFHHVPDHVRFTDWLLLQTTNYKISVGTDDFIPNSIHVEKGVLQVDSLSPLIFNVLIL